MKVCVNMPSMSALRHKRKANLPAEDMPSKEPATHTYLLSTASCIAFNKASAANGFLREIYCVGLQCLLATRRRVGEWAVMKIIGIRNIDGCL